LTSVKTVAFPIGIPLGNIHVLGMHLAYPSKVNACLSTHPCNNHFKCMLTYTTHQSITKKTLREHTKKLYFVCLLVTSLYRITEELTSGISRFLDRKIY